MLTSITPLALLLLAAAQATTPQTSVVKPASAAPPTTTFHSDALHLDYIYDSALIAAPDVASAGMQGVRNEASGKAKQLVDCLSMPLTAIDSSKGIRMVLLMHFDGACLASLNAAGTPSSLVTSTFNGSLSRFGDPQIGSPSEYVIAGHSAVSVNGSVVSTKYGATFYGAATCLMQGADTLCWEFLSDDCSALPALIASPIKFDNQPPAALLPKQLAPACK